MGAQQSSTKVTRGDRAYYIVVTPHEDDRSRDPVRTFTLVAPGEDVELQHQREEDEEKFMKNFRRAEKMDAGLLNPRSDWHKYTCGDLICYQDVHNARVLSLKAPEEGPREEEEEEDAEKFRLMVTLAEKMDAGLLNPRSEWHKFYWGGRPYYLNDQSIVSPTLPPEGIWKENEDRCESLDAGKSIVPTKVALLTVDRQAVECIYAFGGHRGPVFLSGVAQTVTNTVDEDVMADRASMHQNVAVVIRDGTPFAATAAAA